jgi:hypothetical protein
VGNGRRDESRPRTDSVRNVLADAQGHKEILFLDLFLAKVTGGVFVENLKKNLCGMVDRFAPGSLAGCCQGAYIVESNAKASEMIPEALPLHKRWKEDVEAVYAPSIVQTNSDGGFENTLPVEVGLFIDHLSKESETDLLRLYWNLLSARKYPRCVHVALRMFGLAGSNSPSESLWSDADNVFNDQRSRTGEEWGDVQIRVHRNFDVVKKMREEAHCRPGESLELAWDRAKN